MTVDSSWAVSRRSQVPAPAKAAVRKQAEEILRFARAHSNTERDRTACASQARKNFEAGTTTS
jgi:hypothetical protein